MLGRILRLSIWLVGLAVAGYQLAFKPWRRTWDVGPEDSARPLPGDELVPDPEFNQTMAVTIDVPPSAVWPWLLQMGYGRGGWYSYDSIDMLGQSSRSIRPELQDLRAGQEIPLGPGLDFRVAVLESERALVLYGDSELIEREREAARVRDGSEPVGEVTAGLKFIGALSEANASAFRVSWAFVLDPVDGGRTRLLERFRTRSTPGPAAVLVRPIIDIGHFLMTRKQMLGIKERAEIVIRPAPAPQPAELVTAAA